MRSYILILTILFSNHTFSQESQYNKTDLLALQQLPEKWVMYWNQHNIDSLSLLLKEDADVVTVPGTWLKGRERFIKDHQPKFSTIFKESILTRDTVAIRYLNLDLAIIHFGWGISGDLDREGNPQKLRHGIGTWVVIKQSNSWKILSSHMMLKPAFISGK
jgi:uncharacterized protein (TIGR02246 family)